MKITRLATIAIALGFSFAVSAQNQLKTMRVIDITPELSVYPCGDRQEAQVILHCQEPFELFLSSNTDATLDLTVTTDGPEKLYSIVFKTRQEGTSFRGRQLAIQAEGFQKYYIPLNLNAKEKLEFLVTDPYSKLRSLFYTASEEGIRLFSAGMYDAAIDQFNIAKQCPEYNETQNHIDNYIAQCDTLKAWTKRAAELEDQELYFEARALYAKMVVENPECQVIAQRYAMCNENFQRVSRHDMEVGQAYYDTKRYEEARNLFEHAVAQNNPQSAQAGVYIANINLIRYKLDNHTRTLSYVISPDCPIGFMAASLKPDKGGGYFSMGLDKGVFDLAGNSIVPVVKGNVPQNPQFQCMTSIGWAIRLYTTNENQYIPKVWGLVSPLSYAGGGYKTRSIEEDQYVDSFHWINAVAPEVGIAVRVWRGVLSYRLQFRYVLGEEKPLSDNFGKTRNLIGLGFCW